MNKDIWDLSSADSWVPTKSGKVRPTNWTNLGSKVAELLDIAQAEMLKVGWRDFVKRKEDLHRIPKWRWEEWTDSKRL